MLLGATFLLATTGLTFAADSDDEPVQTQAEMNQEAAADFQKADAELNQIYKQVRAGLDADGQAKLKTAQRAWLAYRDAEAELEAAPNEGGSIYPMIVANVKARLTEARVKELKEVLAATEGDDSDETSGDGADVPRDANGNEYGHGYNPEGADDPKM
jgi:uncharacterized protein YecT (DUF1311 family)